MAAIRVRRDRTPPRPRSANRVGCADARHVPPWTGCRASPPTHRRRRRFPHPHRVAAGPRRVAERKHVRDGGNPSGEQRKLDLGHRPLTPRRPRTTDAGSSQNPRSPATAPAAWPRESLITVEKTRALAQAGQDPGALRGDAEGDGRGAAAQAVLEGGGEVSAIEGEVRPEDLDAASPASTPAMPQEVLQKVAGGGVVGGRDPVRLDLLEDDPGELLAQFHAPLVIRIDPPHHPLGENAVLV